MDINDDEHLDVCQNIEIWLREQYELHPELTDAKCIFALDNAKIAIKKEFGYAKNEKIAGSEEIQGIIAGCVSMGLERIGKINDLALRDYLARIEKIRKSVIRHSRNGRRGYYEFIRHYL